MAFHCIAIIFGLGNNSFAQTTNYYIKHYTTNDGLPQNSILGIQFDQSGYCWLATEAGIVRFDNKEFTTYSTNNIPGLLDNRIHHLSITKQGQVYAKNIHRQEIGTTPLQSLFAPSAYLMTKLNPYYYPKSGYANTNQQIDVLWDSIKKTSTLPVVRSYYTTQNEDTYLAYSDYIFLINQGSDQFLKKWEDIPKSTAPIGQYLIQIWPNNKIAVWHKGKLLPINKFSGDILQEPELLKTPTTLFWSPGGTFLYSTKGRLYRLDIEENTATTKRVLDKLPFKDLECINYFAKTNTYYFGTSTNGLFVVKPPIFTYSSLPVKLTSETFYAIGKTSKDALIVKNAFIPKNNPPRFIELHTNQFRCYVDNSDNFYYQSAFDLYRHNFDNHKDEKIIALDENLASILPATNSDDLLICTRRSLTALLFKEDKGSIHWKKELPIIYDDESVNDMYPLEGATYMLTTTNGAKWYNINTNRIEKSILDSISLYAFHQDTKGRLWFTSDGLGIYLYQNNHVYKTPQEILNKLSTTLTFIDDGKGFFWLPSNNGLYKVNIDSLANYMMQKTENLYLYSFNSTDGLRTNEFNGANPSYQWLSDSTLVLASMNGLVEFKPKQLTLNYPDSKIFIDQFTVDSLKLQPSLLKKSIKLAPDFNLLTLKIGSPYFGNPENLQLAYTLHHKGSPMQWQTLPQNGILSINNLSSGNYEIIIRKVGYSVHSKNDELIIQLDVLPRFYNTWLFYILLLIVIFSITYLLFRIRLSRLKKEKEKIEAIVALRTDELHQTAEQLRHSEGALRQSNQQKELIITMVLHDLRSPLRFLKTVTGGIMNTFHGEMSTNLSSSLNKLNGSAVALWEFTDRFFTWAVTQQEDFKIEKTTFPLQEAFNTVASFYSEIVIVNDNKLLIEHTDIVCYTDINILVLTIRNLVDNANKNTMCGTIRLGAYLQDETIFITVEDDGKGLSEAEINLFKSMRRPAQANKGQSGIGSQVIQNMLQKIDGELAIESSSKGSKFTLKLRK